ncbi:hypothetical protein [Mucilaginibacter sp.]|uniref:hypothetical protein n=1 Tax=Mucilaginibacter sp. TaxID=1882438 RepID=UPI003D0F4B3F
MPALIFNINPDLYLIFLNKKMELKPFLEDVLHNEKSPQDAVKSSLLAYHSGDGGSPEIHEFEIAECFYNSESNTGKVKLKYKVFFFFGCSGIKRSDDGTETCTFKIDAAEHKLTLLITDHIMRDTVDEF